MTHTVLAVNPVLAGWGQFAAVVICFYVLVFVILALAFNFAMAFGLSILREKANIIKKLRPTVNSVNRTTTAAIQGTPVSENENGIVRAAASVPAQVHNIDNKVEQTTERVNNAVIEFRARSVQAQTVVKAFLRPRSKAPDALKALPMAVDEKGLEFNSPGYRILMEEKSPELSVVTNGQVQATTASDLKNVSTR